MNLRLRVVLDTNAMVSRLLLPDSIPAKAVRRVSRITLPLEPGLP